MPFAVIAQIFSIMSSLGSFIMQSKVARAQAQLAKHQQALADAEAVQMEQRAGQERASSQRRAIEERKKAERVSSRATAIAGASGAGVSDATVTNLLGDIDTEGELRALTALYEGEEVARGLEYGAELNRAGGAGDAYASRIESSISRGKAFNTIMSASGTLYEKYADTSRRGAGTTAYDRTSYG